MPDHKLYRLAHGGVESPKVKFLFTVISKMNFFLIYIF
jgi:hypothetical protein